MIVLLLGLASLLNKQSNDEPAAQSEAKAQEPELETEGLCDVISNRDKEILKLKNELELQKQGSFTMQWMF